MNANKPNGSSEQMFPENLIAFSIKNKFLILAATLFLIMGSYWSLKHTPLDALPDLSPPQVIVQL